MNVTELCVNCKQNNSCTMCWKTSNKECPHFIQKTNADRIRNWNDHEFAETIANFVSEIDNGDIRYSDDPNDWLKWLQQPAE